MTHRNHTDTPLAPAPELAEPVQAAPQAHDAPLPQALPSAPARLCCLVTGTDMGAGKTLVSTALLARLVASGRRACGMKPVATGAVERDGKLHSDDADLLAAAGNVHLPASITTPFLLRAPCAPHIAAEREQVTITPVPIIAAYAEILAASDAVVVEGTGGFRVPFSADFDSADLAAQLDLPVVLVVGLRPGCLNHALLTVEAIIARGLVLAGWVANTLDPSLAFEDDHIAALVQRIPAPLLGHIPWLAQPTAAQAAPWLDLTGLPGWPPAPGPI